MRGEHVALASELFGGAADEVPVLGVLGGDAQSALLAAAPDADRRVGPLWTLRLVTGVLELIELAVEGRRILAQQAGKHLARFLEAVEALLEAPEFDAVGAGLLLVPARADPELESAVRDVIQRRSHIGEDRGVTVVDAGDERAEP